MNAIDFLIKEHNRIQNLFIDIANESQRFEIQLMHFELLAQDLIRHEHMEHTLWYPHFKNILPDIVNSLIKEENKAEYEIKKMNELKTEATWLCHFTKFKKDVDRHLKKEQEKLFPEASRILSEAQLLEIGAEMVVYKMEPTR
jgi:hypothetical protein